VTRPAYFPARLYDFDIARAEDGSERRPALGVVSAVMDPRDFGTFLTWVGALPAPAEFWAAPDLAPGLIVLPCRVTQHPETDAQLAADAFLTALEQACAHARLAPTEDLLLRLAALTRSMAARAEEIGLIERPSP
jgi:hypothetical protein